MLASRKPHGPWQGGWPPDTTAREKTTKETLKSCTEQCKGKQVIEHGKEVEVLEAAKDPECRKDDHGDTDRCEVAPGIQPQGFHDGGGVEGAREHCRGEPCTDRRGENGGQADPEVLFEREERRRARTPCIQPTNYGAEKDRGAVGVQLSRAEIEQDRMHGDSARQMTDSSLDSDARGNQERVTWLDEVCIGETVVLGDIVGNKTHVLLETSPRDLV